MHTLTQIVERAIGRFRDLVRSTPELAREFAGSRAAFTSGDNSVGELGSRRHLEWFLMERPSEHLEGVPVVALCDAWHAAAGPAEQDLFDGLVGSHASAFLVQSVEPGQGLVLRDIMGISELDVREDAGSHLLEVGDLLVGRVFPLGDGEFLRSPAMSSFRDRGLVQALEQDVNSVRASRRGVLRMQQVELERMFFSPESDASNEDPSIEERERNAVAALGSAGLDPTQAQQIVEDVLGAESGAVVTEVLNHLAFHTPVDLDQARDALIALRSETTITGAEGQQTAGGADTKSALHGVQAQVSRAEKDSEQNPGHDPEESTKPEAPKRHGPLDFFNGGVPKPKPASHGEDALDHVQPTAAPGDVSSALASFDQGRAAGGDIDALFGQLEVDLELEQGDATSSTDEAEDGAPDFPGVVGAMLVEFRWEAQRSRGDTPEPAGWRLLEAFANATTGVGVFEDLPAEALVSFATRDALDAGLLKTPSDAADLLAALDAFASWCDKHHGLEIAMEFRALLGPLSKSLPRLAEARLALGNQTEAGGLLFEIAMVGGSRIALRAVPGGGADDRDGESEVEVTEPVARHLLSGDFARVKQTQGAHKLIGVHPAEARSVLWPSD